MDYRIRTIPHFSHRFETVGDYWQSSRKETQVRVSDMNNEDFEFLVIMHELVEEYLCRKREISEPESMTFDIAFENKRVEGDTSEPGNSPDAPYHKEHVFATKIEKQLAAEIGVDWNEYEKAVDSL